MSKTTTYKVSKQNQLIDLNGTMVNFDLTFTATSKDNLPFETVVMDQAGLDTTPNLEYKQVTEGSISGNIISDKNMYQNFFLVLRAPQETEIEVTIDLKPIMPRQVEQQKMPMAHQHAPPPKSSINWKYVLIFFAVLCIGYIVWKYMGKNTSNVPIQMSMPIPMPLAIELPSSPVRSVPHTPERPICSRSNVDLCQSRNADLIARLNAMRR